MAGIPVITLPDVTECRGDEPRVDGWLSSAFGQPVSFHREDTETHFDDGPVHLTTATSLCSVQRVAGVPVDPRRLRANILLTDADPAEFPGAQFSGSQFPGELGLGDEFSEAGFPEDGWPGCHLLLGDQVVLEVAGSMRRCVMVNNPVDELPDDDRVLKAITAVHHMPLGVFAIVVRGGQVAVGDSVHRCPLPSTAT